MPKTIAVIDGNSLMHRAFHAVPPTMNAPDGTPTNAVFGFLSMLLKFIDVAQPDGIVCAFDAGKPEFRIEAMEQYKAQRPPTDPDLKVQFPIIEDVLESMAIPVVKVKGWEGDDILGTVSARNEAVGAETLLVTGDKDAYQLASDLTRIVTTKKGITDVAIYGPDQVLERYGVTPAQFPDFLGLKGDSADNIPGVPGIGDKGAAKLLSAYGDIEGIYDHLDDLKGKMLQNLQENRDGAFLSRRIATIVRDLDFELDVEGVVFPAFDADRVSSVFGKYGFRSHLSKVLSLIGQAKPVSTQVDLDFSAVVDGDAAAQRVKEALDAGERVGIAFDVSDQATLFGDALTLAVATSAGIALFENDDADKMLCTIIEDGAFSAFDVKRVFHRVVPVDSSKPPRVEAADLFDADFFDVSLAAYLLDSSRSSYTPATVAETHLGGSIPEAKDDRDAVVQRAVVARAAVETLSSALQTDGSVDVYRDIDAPLVAVLTLMERTGAALDTATLAALGADTQERIDELVAKIHAQAGEEFNIDSPKQVGHILFEVLGLPAKKKTKSGYSTDAKVLADLAETHELPALIVKYRELAKIKSTYIDALPRQLEGYDDGLLHTSFNESVTTTGRLSSSDPNLQNIPVRTDFGRHIRACFVPLHDGDVFVSADYSQIELRLLAHLSGDEHLIAAFKSGADFHAATAARVFGIPVEDVTPELRSRAKAVNFGIVYGQQAFGLAQSLHIPFGEAQQMIDRYFEAYPGVRSYLDDVVKRATDEGFATTMFGRKRHIPELRLGKGTQRSFGERTAMNHPMQGSAADIIKLAMIEVERRLRAEFPRVGLMLQVHDELDLSVPADQVEEVSAMLRDVMEHVVELAVPLSVDVSSGANWSEAH